MAKRRTEVAPVDTDWRPRAGDPALVIALARGATVADAAAEAGLSERTAWRRLAEPEVRRCVAEAQAALLQQSVAALADAATRAVETLVAVLDCDDPRAATAAAKVILDYALPRQEALERAAEALRPRVVVSLDESLGSLVSTRPGGPTLALPVLLAAEPEGAADDAPSPA